MNQKALAKVLAEIFAILGIVSGEILERLPVALYFKANHLLRPAEAALRRLIVIAARGVIVKPSVSRPMPKGLTSAPKKKGRSSFTLIDPRKHYEFIKDERPITGTITYVKTYTRNPFNPFDDMYWPKTKKPEGMSAAQICRRAAALDYALNHIPQQARRMVRLLARRAARKKPSFFHPMRPGRPPGHRDRPVLPVDFILKECHALAVGALKQDTS